jgi:hypothetical protein
MATTTNYGWTKPVVGGDVGAWGGYINTDLDGIDSQVKTTDTTANAALPKAGGVMTGRVDEFSSTVKLVDKGTISGAQSLDLSTANYFKMTVNGATTFSFTNVPATANAIVPLMLRITSSGGPFTLTWPAAVKWPGATAMVLTTNGTDLVSFITDDAGTTWRNSGLRQNLS